MPRKKKTEAKEEVVNNDNETVSESIVDENTQPNIQTQEDIVEKSKTAIPPVVLHRNEYGLLDNVDYKYKENGFVDWRAMVDEEDLYPNKEKTSETDVKKLKDNELIIKLGGLKRLANIRGIKSVKFTTDIPSQHYVSSICEITWIPNYETEGREIVYSAASSAHVENVNDFCLPFLVEISTNRSFARCCRNFLNIDIVANEELFNKKDKQQNNQVYDSKIETNDIYEPLRTVMGKLKLSFEKLKTKCANAKDREFKGCENWSSLEDIPKNDAFYLLGKLNDALNK